MNLFIISKERKFGNSLFGNSKKTKPNLSSTTITTVVPRHLKSSKLANNKGKSTKESLKVLLDS